MTSTSEITLCACGCRATIEPKDDHPWFKRAQCQELWTAMQRVPEDQRDQFAWDQRFYHELWAEMPWSHAWWCGPLTDGHVISLANTKLSTYRMTMIDESGPDALADAMSICLHYIRANRAGASSPRDLFADWAWRRYAKPPVLAPATRDAMRQWGLLVPQEAQEARVGPT